MNSAKHRSNLFFFFDSRINFPVILFGKWSTEKYGSKFQPKGLQWNFFWCGAALQISPQAQVQLHGCRIGHACPPSDNDWKYLPALCAWSSTGCLDKFHSPGISNDLSDLADIPSHYMKLGGHFFSSKMLRCQQFY